MEQLDWDGRYQEAMVKALLAGNPRARAAYLDLARFYQSQAQRTHQLSCRATPPLGQQFSAVGGLSA